MFGVGAAGHSAFDVDLRYKADKMLPGLHIDMRTTPEPHAKDRDTAFTRRAAGGQCGWRSSILLREA
jgi:hypothetical protein